MPWRNSSQQTEKKKMANTISVLNGPNLNLLVKRRPEIYGANSLDEIIKSLSESASRLGYAISAFQESSEGALVDAIHKAGGDSEGIIINAAAYSHTSIAIRDALEHVSQPVVEVHLSNIFSREEFRHHSYVSEVAKGVISGFGAYGYELALLALIKELKG